MAKILKIAIRKERVPGQCRYHWPESWDGEASVGANVVAYEDEGLAIEHAIAVVPNVLAERLLADPDIEEIDEGAANEFGRHWRPQHVRLADPRALAERIEAALPQARSLARAEGQTPLGRLLRALDPDDDSEPGLRRSKRFEIQEHLRW